MTDIPFLAWLNTVGLAILAGWVAIHHHSYTNTSPGPATSPDWQPIVLQADRAGRTASTPYHDPVVGTPAVSDVAGGRVARCNGLPGSPDGIGPAAVYRGDLILQAEADLRLAFPDDSIPTASLRDLFRQLTASGAYMPPNQATPTCDYWSEHDIDWRQQAIEQRGDALYCDQDGVGQSCSWRTDWSVAACHPRTLLCTCPSKVVLGLAIETTSFWGVSMQDQPRFWANRRALCSESLSLQTLAMPGQKTVTSAECSHNVSTSMCNPRLSRALQRSFDTAIPAWPPTTSPPSMRTAYRVRQGLRLRIANSGCDNNRAWLQSIPADVGDLPLTCDWKSAASLTVSVSNAVDLDPSLWYLYGVAATLTDNATDFSLSDMCFSQQRLRSCVDLTRTYGLGTDRTVISLLHLEGPEIVAVDNTQLTIPEATLVLDDVY